jgi:ABC-2 type transport system ATP-binding protein
MKNVIEVKNLSKKYGNFFAVDGITFSVEKGEVFGLLGENGAGKTTTLEMIEGLRKPSSGQIEVMGKNTRHGMDKIKQQIGVQLQSSAYFQFLNLGELLNLFASFYSKSINPQELLKMVDLVDKEKSLIGNLSGGQKQRFSIVASLINDPEIIFLDEPTTGLDPIARRNLWELITKIKNQGKTIVLTTHYMEEAELLCDRIAIMDKGKIVAMGEVHKLIEKTKDPFKIDLISSQITDKIFSDISKLAEITKSDSKKDNYLIKAKNQSDLNKVLKLLSKIDPESITVTRATLEDLFIELTGKTILE